MGGLKPADYALVCESELAIKPETQILRFRDATFTSGGKFKLCFCDSSLLGANEICDSPEDFSIEVGTVHSTGLQCLLSNDKMTKGVCKPQQHGGLRCYADAASVVTPE